MKSKIVRIALSEEREDDRRILDYLFYSGIPMTKAMKIAVLRYLDELESPGKEGLSLTNIRNVIREELQNVLLTGSMTPASEPLRYDSGEEPVSPLDFLDELEKMDNF